jgi:hypothetical protein
MDYLLITAYENKRLAAQAAQLRALGNSVETVLLPVMGRGEEAHRGAGA